LVEGHLIACERPGLGLKFDWDKVDGMRVR